MELRPIIAKAFPGDVNFLVHQEILPNQDELSSISYVLHHFKYLLPKDHDTDVWQKSEVGLPPESMWSVIDAVEANNFQYRPNYLFEPIKFQGKINIGSGDRMSGVQVGDEVIIVPPPTPPTDDEQAQGRMLLSDARNLDHLSGQAARGGPTPEQMSRRLKKNLKNISGT